MSSKRPETKDQRPEIASPGNRLARATMRQQSLASGPSSLVSRKAFTLLELLVAATITAVLAGFIVILVSNVAGVWTRTTNRLSADAQARYILDQLALDLSSAQFRDDGNVWFAVDVLNNADGNITGLWQVAAANPKPPGGLSLAMNSANLADARFGTAGVWLRFFTAKRGSNTVSGNVTDSTTVSAPVAVGYQIIRRFSAVTLTNQNTAYLFHRAEVRAAAAGSPARPGVLESGYNLNTAAVTNYTRSNLNGARNDGSATGDPRSIQIPGAISPRNLDSVIASNVIDFGLRCYVRDASKQTGLRLVFPTTDETGNTISNAATARVTSSLPATTLAAAANFNQVMPDVVDVMVRILTDEGARLITLYEQANSPLTLPTGVNAQQYWWQIAMAHSQVFTRRIVINAHSL